MFWVFELFNCKSGRNAPRIWSPQEEAKQNIPTKLLFFAFWSVVFCFKYRVYPMGVYDERPKRCLYALNTHHKKLILLMPV